MNKIHSVHELKYNNRIIAAHLKDALKSSPVIVLTGARQVGKSTLLRKDKLFSGWRYISLDNHNNLAQAQSDPFSLWHDTDRVILDEAQKAPKLLSAVKQSVDEDTTGRRRFVLSGSANLLLMKNVSETLAGRAVYFHMYPMTVSEYDGKIRFNLIETLFSARRTVLPKGKEISRHQLFGIMARGLMPPLLRHSSQNESVRWWESYVLTYLERDLRQLSQVDSIVNYRNFMQALALRSGGIINQAEIARDIRISQPSVYRYLNLLEITCLLSKLPAFSRSRTKRLVKSPKAYYLDPGLASYLSGHYDAASLSTSREADGIFETLVLLHLTVLCEQLVPKAKLFYWRTVLGSEIDFVVEYGAKLLAIEVKLSNSVSYNDTESIRSFSAEHKNSSGIIIYTGKEIKHLTENITAIPVSLLF